MPTKPRTSLKKQAKQERSRATVEAILQAASHILVRRGFDKTSTTRIAERAGVSVGSLYQYFPSKEAIVAELIDRHIARISELIGGEVGAAVAAPLPTLVRKIVEMLFRAYSLDPALHRVFIEQVPRVGRLGRMQEVERDLTQLTIALLDAHRGETRVLDREVAAFVLVRAVAAVTFSVIVERPDAPRDVFVSEITELALAYLGVHTLGSCA